MPAENAGSIYAEVRIRLDQLTNDLKQATSKIDSFERSVTDGTANASKKATSNLSAMSLASIAAAAGIASAFRSLITTTADYSSALAGVQAATRGTSDQLAQLEGAAKSVGDQFGNSTTQALQGIEALAKAGVSTADIMGGALPGALTLAAAGELSVSDAAEIAAATMTQFGLAGSDVTHIADLLAAGAGKAQGEVSDLSQALKQAGLVASQTGLSVDDTVGSLAAFASAGLLGSDAGTSFRTMLLRLTPQSKLAADKMHELGLNAFDAQGEFIGITKFAGQLKTQLAGLTTEQRNSALATIFGTDSIRAANVLYTQGAEGIASWINKVNDAGFAAEVARIKLDNLAGDMKRFDAATTDAGAAVGKSLDPSLRGLTQLGTAFLEFLSNVPAPLLAFVGTIVGLAGGFVALAAAGPPVIAVIVGVGTAAAAALGPLGLIVAGLSALTIGAIAAGSALNANADAQAFGKFKDIAQSSGLAGDALKNFGKFARDVENQLAISSRGAPLTADAFEKMAKQFGLTNDQLAQFVLKSNKVEDSLKVLAAGFIDPTRQAKEFFNAQKASADAIVARYEALSGKALPNVIKAAQGLSDAIAFQNYLEAQGLITAEDNLKAKISLRNDEISRIEKAAAETGKLTDADKAQVRLLLGFNADNQAALNVILDQKAAEKKAEEDLKKAEQDRIDTQKKNMATIAALQVSAIQAVNNERDVLLAANNSENQSEQDRVNNEVAINKDADAKIIKIKKDTQDAADKIVADGLKQQQLEFKTYSDLAFGTFSGFLNALSDLFSAINHREQDELQARYDKEKELIDNNGKTKRQALEQALADAKSGADQAAAIAQAQSDHERELIEFGGKTKKQALETELVDAKATGDQKKIDAAQIALDLYNFDADRAKKTAALAQQKAVDDAQKALDQFNLEQKFAHDKADLEYKAALASWDIQVALAIGQAAQATLNAFSSTAAIPVIGPGLAPFAAAFAAGVGLVQVGAVVASKPQPPKFATGGIVLGNSMTGDRVPALVNSGEMILNAAQQALLFKIASGEQTSAPAQSFNRPLQLIIDGKMVAQSSADWYNSGQIRLVTK